MIRDWEWVRVRVWLDSARRGRGGIGEGVGEKIGEGMKEERMEEGMKEERKRGVGKRRRKERGLGG